MRAAWGEDIAGRYTCMVIKPLWNYYAVVTRCMHACRHAYTSLSFLYVCDARPGQLHATAGDSSVKWKNAKPTCRKHVANLIVLLNVTSNL